MAQTTNMTAGTTMETRQATFGSIPEATIGLKSTDIIKILSHLYSLRHSQRPHSRTKCGKAHASCWVTPPPRLPQPAAVALAVPTTCNCRHRFTRPAGPETFKSARTSLSEISSGNVGRKHQRAPELIGHECGASTT